MKFFVLGNASEANSKNPGDLGALAFGRRPCDPSKRALRRGSGTIQERLGNDSGKVPVVLRVPSMVDNSTLSGLARGRWAERSRGLWLAGRGRCFGRGVLSGVGVTTSPVDAKLGGVVDGRGVGGPSGESRGVRRPFFRG